MQDEGCLCTDHSLVAPEGAETVSDVEENLPEGMEIEEDQISWTEPLDNRTMNCTVRLQEPGELPRAVWTN